MAIDHNRKINKDKSRARTSQTPPPRTRWADEIGALADHTTEQASHDDDDDGIMWSTKSAAAALPAEFIIMFILYITMQTLAKNQCRTIP